MADCTGHGVPGAFMSMLGSTLLHETINIKGVSNDPARILRNLHAGLRNVLHQDKGKNKDGMDISVCIFEKNITEKTVQFTFSGAKSIMYFVANGQLAEVRGDKQYIGGRPLKQEFHNQVFSLPISTIFYLFTDGFADQNDEHRNKLGYLLFKENIAKHHHYSLAEQKKSLLNLLQLHQQTEEQRDDISVVGLRFV
jgi:serine phosphatase RsbU (regulator of sigma subunit)